MADIASSNKSVICVGLTPLFSPCQHRNNVPLAHQTGRAFFPAGAAARASATSGAGRRRREPSGRARRRLARPGRADLVVEEQRDVVGAVASTAPSAGFEPTSRACADAAAGRASASEDDGEATEPAAGRARADPARRGRSRGRGRTRRRGRSRSRRRSRAASAPTRDRVALGPVEQLAADALLLVGRVHTELFDAERWQSDSSIAT